MTSHDLIHRIYASFNARDIPATLALFHPQVRWPKAWDGGYATGHDEVRDYWQRQWQELNPHVEPTAIQERAPGQVEVTVHQLVKDMQGQLVFDGFVKHVYTVRDGLITQMDIEPA